MDWLTKYGWGLPGEILFNVEAIDGLANHLEFIELEIDQRQDHLKRKWQEMEKKKGDPELEYWEIISEGQYVTSRILRNSFLVSLFTVYESITTDIAEDIRKTKGKKFRIKDISRGSVHKTKMYYDDVICFQLLNGKENLKKLDAIYKLRNFIVHENGRFDSYNDQQRNKILGISEGVEEQDGYVLLSKDFLKEAFLLTKCELECLMDRYADWKTSQDSN